jgi:anti-sigma regulatory factor (Ser/Thr protein kinase)
MSVAGKANMVTYRALRHRSAIGHLNAALARWLGARDVPETAVGATQVVMDELIGNLLLHDPQNIDPVEVELRLDADILYLRLSYRSADFNPRAQKEVDTLTPVSERRIGGLGLHLIQGLMDSVHYEYLHGIICLRMQKKLHASGS